MAGNVITSDDTSNKNASIGGNGNSFYHQPTLHSPTATASSGALVHINIDQPVNGVTNIGNNISSHSQSANNRNHLRPLTVVHASDAPPSQVAAINESTSVGRVNYRMGSDSYSVVPVASLASMLPRSQLYHPINLFGGSFDSGQATSSHTMPLLMNSLSSPGHLSSVSHSIILPRGPLISVSSGYQVPQNILEAKCSPLYSRNVKSHPFTCYHHQVPNQVCNSYSIEAPVNGHSVGTSADSSTVTTFSMSSSYKATSYSSTISNGNCIDRTYSGSRPLTSPIPRGQPAAVLYPGGNEVLSSFPLFPHPTPSPTAAQITATTTSNITGITCNNTAAPHSPSKSKSVQAVPKTQANNSLNTLQYLPPQCKCHNCHDRQGDTDAIKCHLPRNTPTDPIVTPGSNKSSLSESMVIQLTPNATVSMSKQPATTDAASVQVQSDKANINDSQGVKDRKDRATGSPRVQAASSPGTSDSRRKKATTTSTSQDGTERDVSRRKDDSAKRRNRHTFSPKQISILENIFDLNTHYPDTCTLITLSKKLKLPMERIQVWFQNRRAKYRRGQLSSAGSSC